MQSLRYAGRGAIGTLTAAALAVVLVLAAFGPGIDAPFDFDDEAAIVENSSIRSLWPPTAIWPGAAQGTPVSGRPVVNYSFAVDYAINRWLGIERAPILETREQTIVFHATNLLLHAVAGVLLFAILRRTFRDPNLPADWRSRADPLAAVAVALWMVLPIQTEAVNYVTQRSELLVSLCYLATLYSAIRARDARHRASWSIVAVLACAIGMLSKEVMVTAPIIVFLYDRAFPPEGQDQSDLGARRWLYAALLVTAVIAIVGAITRSRGHSAGFGGPISPLQYLWSQAWAIPHYVRLAFWPHPLAFDYGVKPIDTPMNIVGFIGLTVAGLATLWAWTKPRSRWLAFLGSWFFLLLAPSSSIVPIHTEIAAERRVYLAIVALVVIVIVLVNVGLSRSRLSQREQKLLRRGLASVAIVAAICASFARSMMYRDLVERWTDAVAATPANGRAYDNLASALLRLEPPNVAAADSVLHLATIVDPTFAPAWFRHATIALAERRLSDAESLLVRTLVLDPNHANAADRLGAFMVAERRPQQAVVYFRDVVRRGGSIEAEVHLGLAHLMLGRFDSAAAVLRAARRRDSSRVDVRRYLAVALLERGRGSEATSDLEQLVRRDPRSGISLALLSLAYAQGRRDSLSARMADSAVANAGENASVYLYAGRALLLTGALGDAAEYTRQGVRLDPNDPQALARLSIVELALGHRAMALALANRALSIAPDDSLSREAKANASR